MPPIDSQFYKMMTYPSVLHSLIQLVAYSVLMNERSDLGKNILDHFTCSGLPTKHEKNQCLHAYNSGPNALQSWIVLVTFLCPLPVVLSQYPIMLKKVHDLQRGNCTVHAHQVYMFHVVLCMLFHLSMILALMMCNFVFDINKLTVNGSFICRTGNSYINCFDQRAEQKSTINYVCLGLQVLQLLLLSFNVVSYCCGWKPFDTWTDNEKPCKKCHYFLRNFTVIGGMFSLSSFWSILFLQCIQIYGIMKG